jgi:hypothetical protein
VQTVYEGGCSLLPERDPGYGKHIGGIDSDEQQIIGIIAGIQNVNSTTTTGGVTNALIAGNVSTESSRQHDRLLGCWYCDRGWHDRMNTIRTT